MRRDLDTGNWSKALGRIVGFEQRKYYGQALRLLKINCREALVGVALGFLIKMSSG